jgi:hypothetical protein
MSERGMKKWAPYKSLNEQDNYLKKLHEKNQKINKPKISSDEAEIINNILVNYHGQELTITYWRDEKVNTVVAIISKIDPINKKIVLVNRKTILMNEIIGLTEN